MIPEKLGGTRDCEYDCLETRLYVTKTKGKTFIERY